MTFVKGEKCKVTHAGRTVDAVIALMSENQLSAFIQFDAMLSGHVGSMPIIAETSTDAARGLYRSIIDGTEVVLLRNP